MTRSPCVWLDNSRQPNGERNSHWRGPAETTRGPVMGHRRLLAGRVGVISALVVVVVVCGSADCGCTDGSGTYAPAHVGSSSVGSATTVSYAAMNAAGPNATGANTTRAKPPPRAPTACPPPPARAPRAKDSLDTDTHAIPRIAATATLVIIRNDITFPFSTIPMPCDCASPLVCFAIKQTCPSLNLRIVAGCRMGCSRPFWGCWTVSPGAQFGLRFGFHR